MREKFFPPEVTGDVAKITVTGTSAVYVEQHKGIAAFSDETVVFHVAQGRVRVEGRDIVFRRYTNNEAVLEGQIMSIHFETPCGGNHQ